MTDVQPPLLADFMLGQLVEGFPAWEISRAGDMLRADRDGYRTRFAQNPAVLAAVLADIEFSRHIRPLW